VTPKSARREKPWREFLAEAKKTREYKNDGVAQPDRSGCATDRRL